MSRNKREGWYRGWMKGKHYRGSGVGEYNPVFALRSSKGNMHWIPKPGMTFKECFRRYSRPKQATAA